MMASATITLLHRSFVERLAHCLLHAIELSVYNVLLLLLSDAHQCRGLLLLELGQPFLWRNLWLLFSPYKD